jgi:hypothetical protein
MTLWTNYRWVSKSKATGQSQRTQPSIDSFSAHFANCAIRTVNGSIPSSLACAIAAMAFEAARWSECQMLLKRPTIWRDTPSGIGR